MMNKRSKILLAARKQLWRLATTFVLFSYLAISGCTTSVKRPTMSTLVGKGKTDLRVGVYNFDDLTNGDHTILWDRGGPWTYDNLGLVSADIVAEVLRNSGHFGAVERLKTTYSNTTATHADYNVVVAGEVKEFKAGFAPHPTVFINPLSLAQFVGAPVIYGRKEGTSKVRIVVLEPSSRRQIEEFSIPSEFKGTAWNSMYHAWAERQERAQETFKVFTEVFETELRDALNNGFGRALIAMTQAGISPQDVAKAPRSAAKSFWNSYAVVVGISQYQHAGSSGLKNLAYADDDAEAFHRQLLRLGWSSDHVKLLTNEQATKRGVEIALEAWLSKAGSEDCVVLFWSGHGFPDPEDPEKVYFACHDTDINIPVTGYRMDKVKAALAERNARNVIILADTCHAGKLVTRGDRGISIVPNIEKMRREQTTPKGWIFMVGADTDRKAIEHTSWTNGAFTHCLLNALSGNADGYLSSGDKDGFVTMGELRAYLNSAMPDETQKVLGVAKRPVITTSTGDPDIWNLTLQAK
jgi:hypothetical protein